MNEATLTKIAEFAKANRVSKVKLMELVESVTAEKKTRTNSKVESFFAKVVESSKDGKVNLSDLRKNGVNNASYVTSVMVERGMLVKVEATKKEVGRGRPTLTFKLV